MLLTFTRLRRPTAPVLRLRPLSTAAVAGAADTCTPSSRPTSLDAVPPSIVARMPRRLLHQPRHPLQLLKDEIFAHFRDTSVVARPFTCLDDLDPVVRVVNNFDELLVPADHVSRRPSDTYYVDDQWLLRTHTSAHQTELLLRGEREFLVAGDVYRRDTIDASHSPVFHQMEGVRVLGPQSVVSVAQAEADLKAVLEGMVQRLFGKVEMKWVEAYFPFTHPSWELEMFFEGKWLEVLGCGVVHSKIMDRVGLGDQVGWAFGLGLERLAMVRFGIPDIRLFWSTDSRFSSQFSSGDVRSLRFKPYSKYPPCLKDITFWTPEGFHEHTFFDLVRAVAGDLVELVEPIDTFVKKNPDGSTKTSMCFRVTYRSMDQNLTTEEVNVLQEQVRARAVSDLGVTLR